MASAPPASPAGHHRITADYGPLHSRFRRAGEAGHSLHRAAVAVDGFLNHVEDAPRYHFDQGRRIGEHRMGREGTDRIRLGVIGYGYWGPNLARAFHDLPHSQLVAIADQKEEQLQRAVGRHPGVALVTDYRELFDMGL